MRFLFLVAASWSASNKLDDAVQHCENSPSGQKWDIFKDAVLVLNEVSAKYAVSSGSLLFYYRDCSVGDIDMDVTIDYDWFRKHSHKLYKGLENHSWKKKRTFGIAGNKFKGYEESYEKEGAKLDLFMLKNDSGRFTYGLTVDRITWPCKAVLQKYGKHVWNGVTFNVPEPVEPYLLGQYGDWRSRVESNRDEHYKKIKVHTARAYTWSESPFWTDDGQDGCHKKYMLADRRLLTRARTWLNTLNVAAVFPIVSFLFLMGIIVYHSRVVVLLATSQIIGRTLGK